MPLQDTDNLIVSRSGTNYRMPAIQLKDYAGAKVEISSTPPVSPDPGTLWWDTISGRLYVRYVDVDGAQWVETSPQGIDETRFVNTAGDTMTGTLTAPNVNTTTLNGGSLAGLRNRIINGDFRLDQRSGGSSVTITAGSALIYTADRFYAYCTGANVSGQRITVAGPEPDPFRYQFTGAASVTGIGIAQRIEAQNCRDLAGKTATLSVNLSNSLLTTVNWQAFYANTNDTFGTLASPTRTSIASGSFTVNGTYSRYSTQISIPAAATTGIEIVFTVGAQTSGTWVIGQVQLEEGSVATPFEQRPIGIEELLCHRYFCRTAGGGLQDLAAYGATNSVTTYGQAEYDFPVEMRVTPSIITSSASLIITNCNGLAFSTRRKAYWVITASNSPNLAWLFYLGSGFIAFAAEL